ncbi:hypothetical protein IE4803_PA00142 (plasmid) [Rhizobium etli bv. phaseoli str. IE4803]|nr:hypothetical protein IE4803_PA00142 [Rhizobium etli bv. phaseoli str. IE4803]
MYQEFCFLASNLISGMSFCQPTRVFNHTIVIFGKNYFISICCLRLAVSKFEKKRYF